MTTVPGSKTLKFTLQFDTPFYKQKDSQNTRNTPFAK